MRALKNLLILLKAPSLLIAISVAFAVWAFFTAGLISRPQGWMYDAFTRYPLISQFKPPDVFLAEYDLKSDAEIDWLELTDALLEQGAALVVYPTPPRGAGEQLYQRAGSDRRVLLGHSLLIDSYTGEVTGINAPHQQQELDYIVAAPEISEDAVYRRMPVSVSANGTVLSTVEVTAAARYSGLAISFRENDYRVNFLPGGGYIPRINALDVVNGGLIPQLAKGRIALVGAANFDLSNGLHTPISRRWNGLMSDLEFRAFAIDTLTKNRLIREVPAWVTLLLMTLIAFVSVLVYEYLNIRSAIFVTLGIVFLEGILAWATLSLFHLWLPVAGLMVVQLALFGIVFAYLESIEEAALRRMIVETTVRIQERINESSFFSSDQHWEEVIRLVTQVLHLERVIFLERVEGDHRVREIQAHNCQISDIDEMRRDYERTPYSTALEAKGPLLITRTYFSSVAENEQQYLVPLVFAGEVLGFWAFTVMEEDHDEIAGFENITRDLGEQIAELLSHRKQWQQHASNNDNFLRQLFELDNQRSVYNSLRRSLLLLEKRIDLSDSVSRNMHMGSIMFDPFGHIIYINAPMEAWARDHSVPIFELNALELIKAAHGDDDRTAREYLQHVMLEGKSLRLPIRSTENEEEMSLMTITAVKHSDEWTSLSENATPFELVGILFEIGDVSEVARLFNQREDLRRLFNRELHSEFAELQEFLESKIQEAGRRNVDEWQEVVGHINKISKTVDDAAKYTGSTSDMDHGYLPIDANSIVHRAVTASNDKLRQRGLTVDYEPPKHIPLVMADELSLMNCIEILIQLLTEDAIDKTELKIELTEVSDDTRNVTIFRLQDNGFGIPNERLQSYLDGVGGTDSDPFIQLRRVKERVELWRGELSAQSKIGMGLEFEIALPTYRPGEETARD